MSGLLLASATVSEATATCDFAALSSPSLRPKDVTGNADGSSPLDNTPVSSNDASCRPNVTGNMEPSDEAGGQTMVCQSRVVARSPMSTHGPTDCGTAIKKRELA